MMFDRTTFLYYFIIMCVIFIGSVFFLAFKVEALDFGKLSLEKIETFSDEKYIIDLTQEQFKIDTNNYQQLNKYDCAGNTCHVDAYRTPNNEKGYVLIMETDTEFILSYYGIMETEDLIINKSEL